MSPKTHHSLESTAQPWSTGLVLVCSECDGGRGLALTQDLKQAVKAAGHKKEIRVARVRCLGICPKHGVAVTVTGSDRYAESYVADARDDGTVPALLSAILRG